MLRAAILSAVLTIGATVAIAEPGAPASSPDLRSDHQASPAYATSPEVAVVRQWTEFAATAGPFGLIVVMGYVIRVLWREDKDKDEVHAKELAERDAEIKRLHERRADDGIDNARRITEVATSASATVADNIKAMAEWGSTIRAVRDQGDTNGRMLGELASKVGQNSEAISRIGARGHA